jgi:hypothetical protein
MPIKPEHLNAPFFGYEKPEDVLDEDPDTFRNGPYRAVVDQIITYLWPCEPVS